MQQLPLDIVQPPAPTLKNFIVGPNGEAIQAVNQIISGQPPARIVFLSGPAGSGKSHLLNSLADLPTSQRATGPEMPTDAGGAGSAPIWLADDVGTWSDQRLQGLFNLINVLRTRPGTCLVVTDRNKPAQLDLRSDLRTRLAAGLVIGLELLSDEDKIEALKEHCQERGLKARDTVCRWLLTYQDRDIRHLLAYLDAIDRYALQTNRELTVPLLREFERNRR